MNDTQLFAFEDEFVTSLRCIPMAVRMKLDRVGIKLTLRQWSRLTIEDRGILLSTPCTSDDQIASYRSQLMERVALRSGELPKPLAEPAPALWECVGAVPPVVESYARSAGVAPPGAGAWRDLSELQRFALIKLTRDNHDNVNFLPAMREFGLIP